MGKRHRSGRRLPGWIVGAFLVAIISGTACQASDDEARPADRSGAAPPAAMVADEQLAGITDDSVLFGQSAAFTGPSQELGLEMRLGIQAAFQEQNQAGGVHGRQLELTTLDDFYEPDSAYLNTQRLINREGVFALIGEVGTPTARSASRLANSLGVPFVAPFTGAELLRDPDLGSVVNLRASYYQEIDEMVERLTEDAGITRVAVLYQSDSYGKTGLDGVRLALERRGLSPVASWFYQRNTSAVKTAVVDIVESNPEAVIMIGAYSPVAKAVRLIREDIDPVFMTVSFVGSNALARELGAEATGVYVTQVVPPPGDTSVPFVDAYHTALQTYDPDAAPGFVSLEGYLAGRLAIAGLDLCGPDLSRQCFLDAIRGAGSIDIEGLVLEYGPSDNQGSDAVFLTVIGSDGNYRLVEELEGVER